MKSHIGLFACTLSVPAVLLSVAAPAAAPAPDGVILFRTRCQSCHSVTPGQTSPLAPNLAGVVGRNAAATGFTYSPALKASRLVWSSENLDRFLSGPNRMVPGTRMVITVSDPGQRAAIVNFLGRGNR